MREEERRFFAASNTEKGFYSLFDSVFSQNDFKKIVIIKAGPGMGKSTLMRKTASDLKAKGHPCDLYYCSSDSDSLDGIVCPSLSAAVFDGTAPHTADPVLPGACETVLSLYPEMDVKGLRENRGAIQQYKAASSRLYGTAYSYLAAAGRLDRDREARLKPYWKKEKAQAALRRFLRSLEGEAEKGTVKTVFADAYATKGKVHFDTFEKMSRSHIAVTDRYGAGALLLLELEEICRQSGISAVRIPTPLRPDRLAGLFLCGANALFSVCPEKETESDGSYAKTFNVTRFLDHRAVGAESKSLRTEEKNKQRLIGSALEALREAGEVHASLEKIYGAHTDFSRYDVIEKALVADILG